jgi:hypothetical protein
MGRRSEVEAWEDPWSPLILIRMIGYYLSMKASKLRKFAEIGASYSGSLMVTVGNGWSYDEKVGFYFLNFDVVAGG